MYQVRSITEHQSSVQEVCVWIPLASAMAATTHEGERVFMVGYRAGCLFLPPCIEIERQIQEIQAKRKKVDTEKASDKVVATLTYLRPFKPSHPVYTVVFKVVI